MMLFAYQDSRVTDSITEWTNEKHSLYLKSMEASFVNQLYNSMDFHGRNSLKGNDVIASRQIHRTPSGQVQIFLFCSNDCLFHFLYIRSYICMVLFYLCCFFSLFSSLRFFEVVAGRRLTLKDLNFNQIRLVILVVFWPVHGSGILNLKASKKLLTFPKPPSIAGSKLVINLSGKKAMSCEAVSSSEHTDTSYSCHHELVVSNAGVESYILI